MSALLFILKAHKRPEKHVRGSHRLIRRQEPAGHRGADHQRKQQRKIETEGEVREERLTKRRRKDK